MVGSEIKNIQSRISGLKSHLETYGIKSLSEATSSTQAKLSQLRRTYSHTVEDDFVGFKDVEKLVEYLVSRGDGCYSLVAICGLGGSGKSTIARKVYNHTKVKRRFEAFAWICVSQNWQARDILQQILTKFIPQEKDEIKKLSDAEMIKKLFELQQKKSCLIVVDDIWKKDAWDSIKEAFPKENKTSKLLLTSRNKDVAIHVNPDGFLYEPRALSEDEAWVLLKKKAFSKNVHHHPDPKELEEMEKLGMEMVSHCKGLPLGIVVLGGILASKRHLDDWKNVRRNIKTLIRRGESREKEHGGVSQILELSYADLPYYLKPCFLYLANYLEDEKIDTENLYQLWMAESMVLSDGKGEGETMMDIAESYLGELAQRSMVQVQLNDKQGYEFKRFYSCHMHDMIRDLCLSKAKEEHFFHSSIDVDNQNGIASASSSMSTARRVVIYSEGDNVGGIPVSTYSPQLRSLRIYKSSDGRPPRIMKSHLSDFKLLRSLAIERFNYSDDSDYDSDSLWHLISDYITLPNAIGSLIHLRYLSLEDSSFVMFPTCIKKLKHLQTLILRGCGFLFFTRCMGNVLSKMSKLRHLYLPDELADMVGGNKLILDKSINLEILDNYDPAYHRSEDLMKLINLQKFSASVNSNHLEATKEIISYLSSTKAKNMREASLHIFYCIFDTEEWQEIFTQLLQPSCVHTLNLGGPISIKLPRYNNSSTLPSSRLTQLSLYDSKLEEDPMPILEAFPNLLSFTLSNAFQGTEMSCSSNGFPRLRSLKIWNMDNLESLKLENGALPRLSKLKIRGCKSMKTIPDGLRFITSLQTLKIEYMHEEFTEKVEAVQNGEKGEDFGKIGHVPSIIISKSY
jgi:hypothetical protein